MDWRLCMRKPFTITAFLLAACLLTGSLLPAWAAADDSGFSLPPGVRLGAVAYGNGTYVATGTYTPKDGSTYASVILTSPDGAAWTVQPAWNNTEITGITYANDLFVAVGRMATKARDIGTILTSGDGVHWNINNLDIQLHKVVYGNGTFVVEGDNYTYTSPDGLTWASHPHGHEPLSFFGGNFINIAVNEAYMSPDGVNWTEHDFNLFDMPAMPSNMLPYLNVTGATCGDGAIVAVGEFSQETASDHDLYPIVLKSPDGIGWTKKRLDKSCLLRSITYGNGIFVATENRGGIFTSQDGENWIPRETGTKAVFAAVSYCNDHFIAVGYDGATSTSPDGVNWVSRKSAYNAVFTVGKRSYVLNDEVCTMDAAPFIDNGRVFVPMRYLADAMGAQTNWYADIQSVSISRNVDAVNLVIGSKTFDYDGRYDIDMDVVPIIRNGRTYLPARYVADAFGYTVSWDQNARTVTLK